MHTVWPHLPHAHGVSLAGRIYPERLGRNYPVRQRHRIKQLSLYEVVARPPVDITSVANKQEIINKHYWPLHYMMPVSFTHANIYLSKTLIVIKCVLSTFKHYNKRINTHTHACLLHSRPHLHTPEARDHESSVSNRFVGGLYSPVAAIPPASPRLYIACTCHSYVALVTNLLYRFMYSHATDEQKRPSQWQLRHFTAARHVYWREVTPIYRYERPIHVFTVNVSFPCAVDLNTKSNATNGCQKCNLALQQFAFFEEV